MSFKNNLLRITLAAFLLISLSSCSAKRESETKTTQVIQHSPDSPYGTRTTETNTTIEKSDVVDRDRNDAGLFSILRDIIALPFRAVGALLNAIF